MTQYTYKCLQNEKIIEGQTEQASFKNLQQFFQEQQMYPLFYCPTAWIPQKKLKTDDIHSMIQQMSYLMDTGLKLVPALKKVGHHNERLKKICQHMARDVAMGQPFSQAFKKYTSHKAHIIHGLLLVGESKGDLKDAFKLVIEYLSWQQKQQKKIMEALRYPFCLALLMGAMLWGFFEFLIPLLKPSIELSSQTSWATYSIFYIHSFYQNNLSFCLFIFLTVAAMLFFFNRYMPERKEKLLQHAPIIGTFRAQLSLYQFSKEMSVLLDAGTSLRQSLQVACQATTNPIFKKIWRETLYRIEKGCAFSDALSAHRQIPQLSLDMIRAGEQSNKLGQSFFVLSGSFHDALEHKLNLLRSYIPPLLFLFMGSILIWIFLGLFYPLYDMPFLESMP